MAASIVFFTRRLHSPLFQPSAGSGNFELFGIHTRTSHVRSARATATMHSHTPCASPRAAQRHQVISGSVSSPFLVAEGATKIYPNLFRLIPTDAVLADAALELTESLEFQSVAIITDQRDFWATGVTDRVHSALQRDENLVEVHYRRVLSVDDARAAAHEIRVMRPICCIQISNLGDHFCVPGGRTQSSVHLLVR